MLEKEGRVVTIDEAREISKRVGASILWRPNGLLPEEKQYAVVLNTGDDGNDNGGKKRRAAR